MWTQSIPGGPRRNHRSKPDSTMNSTLLAHTDHGSSSPVVLVHAFPLSRRMWNAQVESWSQKHRVIAPDLPGFGESPSPSEFTMESCGQEVRSLLSTLGVREKVVLVGLSM